MYHSTFHPLQPDIDTDWGSYTSPFVPYNPLEYTERNFPVPSEIHGRHDYRMQPRPVGPGVRYGADDPNHPGDQKIALIILIAVVGLLAYYWGASSKKTRSNPPRRRRTVRRRRRNPPRDDLGRFLPEE